MAREITRGAFLKGAAAAGLGLAAGLAPAVAQTAPLIKRRIPKSGEEIVAVGLGTAQTFGDAVEGEGFEARKAVIRALIEGGGALIDTAPTYSRAEEVVGRALAELQMREKAFLSTKISTTGEDQGIAHHRESVANLRSERIDLEHVHNLRDTETHLRTLRRLKDAGRIRYIGVTTSFDPAHERMVETMTRHELDWIQVNYALDARAVENRILPLARDKGIAVMINVPFGRDRLFNKVRGKPLPEWAAEFDAKTWAQFFLKFVIAHPAVTAAIPGTNRAAHMTDNIGAARGRLPDAGHIRRMIGLIESV
jgi:aryl-alcohol dehydrogenase-like predicted oxidoreductase